MLLGSTADFDLTVATTCWISAKFNSVRSKACIGSFGCSIRGISQSGSSRFGSLCTYCKYFSISSFAAFNFSLCSFPSSFEVYWKGFYMNSSFSFRLSILFFLILSVFAMLLSFFHISVSKHAFSS